LGEVEILAYPRKTEQNDRGVDGVFIGKTVASFARETGADLTVNASPFETPRGPLAKERRTVGIFVYEGEVLSPPRSQYAAVLFSDENRAAIIAHQDAILPLPPGTRFAFGGFFMILQEGTILETATAARDARTAVGVGADGCILYVLVAPGEGGRGLTHGECAALLRDAGARDALAMDGGSSTCLVYDKGKKYPAGPTWRGVGTIIGFASRAELPGRSP
jgi:exopolysaccharide biosynthesis protein